MCKVLPEKYIPLQYINRASEAQKIFSVKDSDTLGIASKIAIAELVQMTSFVVQTVFYSLAFFGYISPTIAGGVAIGLIPIQALCSYNTFVHFKPFSRTILTIAAAFTLTTCASFALSGIVTDSAITLCAGGIALHTFRNLSEFMDARRSRENPNYLHDILGQSTTKA